MGSHVGASSSYTQLQLLTRLAAKESMVRDMLALERTYLGAFELTLLFLMQN